MGKKVGLGIVGLFYVIYMLAIAKNINTIGDFLSPILMLIMVSVIFFGFVIKQDIKYMKWFGIMISLAVFVWFLCDTWWGIQTLVLHVDPEENWFSVYGYSFTNLFLFIAILFSGFQDFKRMNKIQALLDTVIVSICIAVLLWLFVFEQKNENVYVLLSDPISMISLLIDVVLYAWVNVWAFSTRALKPPIYHRILVTGGLLFVVVDFIYYYIYFYKDYTPNSWIDGAYMISFTLLALSAHVKGKEKLIPKNHIKAERYFLKVGVELFILFVPVIVIIFKKNQISYFILLVVSLLIYYVLINFSQKSIFQEKLLEVERKNVAILEKTVEQRTEEIIQILNTDFVSGLYSRRYFESNLSEVVHNIEKNEKVALLFIDQNKSKAIKYLYGKNTAEKVIKLVAASFQNIVSDADGMIAAYGDDAFVVMVYNSEADLLSIKIAEEMIQRCNELFFVDNHAIRVTINIGIACYPTDTFSETDLIKNSDIAMSQARTKGFNRIQLYNENLGNLTYNRHRIELKLKKVEYDREFFLYFQPQVFCDSGKLCGFETLIRWFEGGKNFIPPLDFIPVAEEIGIIVPLGYWIIENAAKQQAEWKKKTGVEYRIAVNVSSKQLVEVDFVQKVDLILKKYQINPEVFEIEITESQQIENSISILDTLNDIKNLGISIAIDDFGTGYSSLYYIKNIPADRIKIAKELIDHIESDVYSHSIVQMVLSIAKVKGIKVIAEGVETKEQWECLKDLGCDEIQGYFFSKPMPTDKLEESWIKIEGTP